MELTERKLKILQAIINSYVKTAEPVGSRTLSRQFDNAISPATIRNEMSDLEEMGYLTHPHTSAGRVPSDKAYRLYINDIMGTVELPAMTKQQIREKLRDDMDEFDSLVQRAAELLSEMTNLTSFALSPVQSEERLKFVSLMPVDERSVILMIASESGKSRNKLVRLDSPYTEEALQILAKNMTYNYRGRKLTDVLTEHIVEDFKSDAKALAGLAQNVMPNFMKTLENMLNVNLYIDGLSNIFDIPEFSDISRAKDFISLLDRKENLVRTLMERDDGMIVTIGSENREGDLSDYSLITASYHVDGRFVGKIGVIGPTRMKYGEITSVMNYLTENLSGAFKLEEEKDDG